MPNLDQETIDKAAKVDGLRIILPLLEASFAESTRITEQLESANVKSCFLDGFAAGLEEGAIREAARIRGSLGIREKKELVLDGEYYFNHMSGYPYKKRDNA